MVSPSRCPPWQPERPGPTRREPRRAQRSYTTPRDTIAVISGTVEHVATCAAAREASEPPFQVFADVKGKILEGFRELLGDSGSSPFCLLLDANQRMLGQIEAAATGEACVS